jgi:hypothetical protein
MTPDQRDIAGRKLWAHWVGPDEGMTEEEGWNALSESDREAFRANAERTQK